MQFNAIKELVTENFQAVDDFILKSLHSSLNLINDIGKHLVQGGGKRVRPLVLLLIAKACGYKGKQDIDLATVIEFIHTATLLHDDVVDNSHLRRGRQTANTVWGNKAAILVGDFIYSRAFQILTSVANQRVMQIMAETTNTMAEGEVLQLIDRHNPEITEGIYLNIIRSKTAKLFEAATQLGAVLSNATPSIQQAMALYGMHLGTAFQLIDDMMDYQASPSQTGKNIGNDLAEGKVTLPLIHAIQNGNAADVRLIKHAIQERKTEDLPAVQKAIERTGSIAYTVRFAQIEVKRAQEALLQLPASVYREGAHALAQFALERTS